ncbi:MAG: FliM/FliN family flagellar motor C-terminal domain-containing protein [Lysobacteraceae bacterium]
MVVETLGVHRPDAVDAGNAWWVAANGEARLSLRIGERTFERLGALLAGASDDDASGLSAGIGRRALEAFASVCLSVASGGWTRLDGLPPPADIGMRHGAAGFLVTIGPQVLEVRFNAALCRQLAPPDDPDAAPLVARHDAIAAVGATFDVVLVLGRVPLADSLAFAPGDVIRTAIPLGAGLQLVADRGQAVLAGTLVADDAHRALKVTQLRPTGDTIR